MTFESVSIRKCIKMIILLICLLLSCCGCSNHVEEDNYDEWVYQQVQEELKRDKHYTIFENNDGTYLFEIYNSEGNVVWRDILYDEPTIQLYDSRYVEVQWGVGTGVWMDIYYDLETCFITQPIECARYIENGIVAIVVDGEKRVLRLWNPFSYSNYLQNIEMDFNTEMANPSDCIIQLTKKEEMELLVEYWNEAGEKATTKICMEPDLYDYEEINETLIKYLDMPVNAILEATGENMDSDGTIIVFEEAVFFPCIYLKDSPFFVICRSNEEEYTPLYVSFYEDCVSDYLKQLGLDTYMNFADIMNVMGNTDINQSGGKRRYKIEYEREGLKYIFCSDDEEGSNFEMYIGRVEK